MENEMNNYKINQVEDSNEIKFTIVINIIILMNLEETSKFLMMDIDSIKFLNGHF